MFQPLCQHDFFPNCLDYVLLGDSCSCSSALDSNFSGKFSHLLLPLQLFCQFSHKGQQQLTATPLIKPGLTRRRGWQQRKEEHVAQVGLSTREAQSWGGRRHIAERDQTTPTILFTVCPTTKLALGRNCSFAQVNGLLITEQVFRMNCN